MKTASVLLKLFSQPPLVIRRSRRLREVAATTGLWKCFIAIKPSLPLEALVLQQQEDRNLSRACFGKRGGGAGSTPGQVVCLHFGRTTGVSLNSLNREETTVSAFKQRDKNNHSILQYVYNDDLHWKQYPSSSTCCFPHRIDQSQRRIIKRKRDVCQQRACG